jgi:hypothetical protein
MRPFLPQLPHPLHDAERPLTLIDSLLQGTLAARRAQRQGQPLDELLAKLRADHDAIAQLALPHIYTTPDPIDPADARHAFAAGALRLMYYRQTVLSRRPLIDTAGSKTLSEYEPDLHTRTEDDAAAWRAHIARACSLSPQDIDAIEASILPDELHAIAHRKRIMDAIVELLHLDDDPKLGAQKILDAVFPSNPLRYPEADIICTSASIYLCLPYDNGKWTTRGDEQLEDQALQDFLRLISRPLQTTMAHFPAFAPVDPDAIHPTLLRQIADHCGQTIDEVRQRLCTMITILPTPKIDQFIIHDIWGHQWQAHLFQFEEAYIRVAQMTTKPPISAPMLDTLRLLQRGDEAAAKHRWLGHLLHTLDQNLLDSLTGLIAEIFADAIEYKFLIMHPERRADLLSSSYFKELPTKLDLTLADLPLYFRFATRGLTRLATPEHLGPLKARLADELPDWDPLQLDACVDTLSAWTAQVLEAPDWRRSLHATHHDDTSLTNAFSLVAIELTRFQLAFNALHAQLDAREAPTHKPMLPRYHDLLIFTAASFFEQDRERNVWRLTSFIQDHFLPLYDALTCRQA